MPPLEALDAENLRLMTARRRTAATPAWPGIQAEIDGREDRPGSCGRRCGTSLAGQTDLTEQTNQLARITRQ